MEKGQILNDRYQLEEKLGNSPGRQTWLTTDLKSRDREKVVVKLLAFSPQMQWEELKLFEREAQVLKSLNHPKIPRYRDSFSLDNVAGDGLPWFGLVQDYITGSSFKKILESGQSFTEKDVQNYAEQILKILQYLHELSPPVIHRDLKPSNLILGEDQTVYLVDFGAVQDRAKAQGVTFTVVGTQGYAPPEQLWGKTVPASDLYALGATLIHLLTGISPADLPQNQMRLDFHKSLKGKIKPSLETWLESLTHPVAEQRPKTAREANQALQGQANAIAFSSVPKVNYGRFVVLAAVQILTLLAGGYFAIPRLIDEPKNHQQDNVRQSIGNLNHRQVLHHQKMGEFFPDLSKYDSSLNPVHSHLYDYSVTVTKESVMHYAIPRGDSTYKAYVGAVVAVPTEHQTPDGQVGQDVLSIVCESKEPGVLTIAKPIYSQGRLTCGDDSNLVF